MTRTHLAYLCVLILILAGPLVAEEIRLTTYYPSPSGVFDHIEARTATVQETLDVLGEMSVDGHAVMATNPASRVGIGTDNPRSQVEIKSTSVDGVIWAGAGANNSYPSPNVELRGRQDATPFLDFQSDPSPGTAHTIPGDRSDYDARVIYHGDGGGYIGLPDTLAIEARRVNVMNRGRDGAESRLFVNEVGKIGIRNTNPQQELDVHGNVHIGGRGDGQGGQLFLSGPSSSWTSTWLGMDSTWTEPGKRWFHIGGETDTDGIRRTVYAADRHNFGGRVGIGQINPQQPLDVNGNAHIGGQLFLSGATSAWTTTWLGMDSTWTEPGKRWFHIGGETDTDGIRRTVYAADRHNFLGRVGIGQVNPQHPLDVNGNIAFAGQMFVRAPGSPWTSTWLGMDSTWTEPGKRWFHIGGETDTDGIRRTAYWAHRHFFTGKVGIGTTNPQFALDVEGNARKTVGSDRWLTSSDGRLKQNIMPLQNALDQVLALRGISFEWKDPRRNSLQPGRHMGMIAQEVEKVFPEWVHADEKGYKLLGAEGFDALFIEALRELKKENESLKEKIRLLEEKNLQATSE
ncbi:MAG: tail fiber domain-containing protein [Candidatus Omnitrophica bacterium]|nr:tail fiber domain-containing protein [Candidatus Omnitrophota bacterium]